jgi:hypothetical protein
VEAQLAVLVVVFLVVNALVQPVQLLIELGSFCRRQPVSAAAVKTFLPPELSFLHFQPGSLAPGKLA